MKNLLKHWLIKYRNREEGFTFLECLVAIIVLSMAFALNGQMVLMLKMQNLKQEIESAAVAVGKDVLDDLRFQLGKNVTNVTVTGNTPTTLADRISFGHTFDANVYVCTDNPTVEDEIDPQTGKPTGQIKVSNCPSSSTDRLIRYIVVQVIDKKRDNEKIYTVQTNFAQLQR
ncbi:prepilin-type N-terminal cleavage/methylation domain-containing protein [Cyanobacterium sp. Dongsha4]|uniref:type IV pilus modification PilV family protein n=1 Tax=Cyanobacterium sp. DS4 TaxID=2878255 RepID=UPI002E8147B4|nr:prepilin-type N-terminal cleavage/methylation domain-containing protein [Cyanobacterium sp. Dongsha4]WVL02038.1 prepilin-type N-terminal cleavage/methylation domain-containing protein [Cyanobacterium sp. Dongsha4]